MIDRGDAGAPIGEDLLIHADVLFESWSKVRAGTSTQATFATETLPWLRREVRTLLEFGS